MIEESTTISFTVIKVRPGSLDIDLMSSLWGLATAVNQIPPPHDFS
jgi:hypothetical protein